MAVRLYVDFNTMAIDPKERVYINTHTQPVLMQELHPGLVVTLYDDERWKLKLLWSLTSTTGYG